MNQPASREYAVFVSSSDAYSDLWDLFFSLFKKYWPGFSGTIYLNTEEKDYRCEGLNIVATRVGRHRHFGETFHAGLDRVQESDVLLMMIDYLFMGPVSEEKLARCFRVFKDEDWAALCLYRQGYPNVRETGTSGVLRVFPYTAHLFSFQTAFWKKAVLREMVADHESPWTAEYYGTLRANVLKLPAGVVTRDMMPIPYLPEGALREGKWVQPMIEFLNGIGAAVDYAKRGRFVHEGRVSLGRRIWRRALWFRGSARSLANVVSMAGRAHAVASLPSVFFKRR
jgi:hypothetical protein